MRCYFCFILRVSSVRVSWYNVPRGEIECGKADKKNTRVQKRDRAGNDDVTQEKKNIGVTPSCVSWESHGENTTVVSSFHVAPLDSSCKSNPRNIFAGWTTSTRGEPPPSTRETGIETRFSRKDRVIAGKRGATFQNAINYCRDLILGESLKMST